VRKAENLPLSCADVKKCGGLNLLEPCGPVQACNGTAFTQLLVHYFFLVYVEIMYFMTMAHFDRSMFKQMVVIYIYIYIFLVMVGRIFIYLLLLSSSSSSPKRYESIKII
jgi:hypothetical protein